MFDANLTPNPTASSSPAPAGINRPALHLEVVDRLLDMIADGSLAPNQRIDERVICEQLAISRTPLREALLVLESAGMVVLSPRRGARVTKLEPEQIREILEMLGGLEAMAGELACRNASNEDIAAVRRLHDRMVEDHGRGDLLAYFKNNEVIHSAIVRMAGNSEIARVHAGLRRRVVRELYLPNGRDERWVVAIKEHEDFLDALERRDAPRLCEQLKLHAQHTWDELSRSMTEP